MAAEQALPSEQELVENIQELRQDLLPIFLALVPLAGWGWYYYMVSVRHQGATNFIPFILVSLVTGLALGLRRRHYRWASWITVGGLILVQILLAHSQVTSMPLAFGAGVVMAASALLGTVPALGAVVLTWLAGTLARDGLPALLIWPWKTLDALALYVLVWGLGYFSWRPLHISAAWALHGWARARKMLQEIRDRRGELYRVVRALEEASYRIERMNQELITARKEAELARALKARFVATVSHELRGPLNLILGFSRLMALSPEKYGEPLPPAYYADVDAIYRNTQHLVSLVDDILDLSQVEAERLPLVKDKIDLEKDVVRRALEMARPLAERKGLTLREELAGDLPWILADEVRLRQVLLNLLTNAIRLTERGGIVVRTGKQAGEVVFSVQDTGPGIAPEDMPKLFQEFRPLGETKLAPGSGSGLGLSISKQLIELHGGRIWAESTLGQGSTFYVALPLPGTEPLTAKNLPKGEPAWRKQRHEVCLVVHDDPNVVRLLSRYIEAYRIIGVTEEHEVAELTEMLHPRALVTTPERLPRLSEQLVKLPYSVPVISCAMPHLSDVRLEGVLSYLVKPVSPEVLGSLMRQVERDGETKVLLVDDEPDSVRLMEDMLTLLPHPYKIFKAYDGQQALAIMRRTVPDVAFVDLLMPGLSGEQLIVQMRAEERLRQVPVVIVSAKDWVEGGVTFAPPISVQGGQPLDVTKWAKCLQSLLETLNPRYLPETTLP